MRQPKPRYKTTLVKDATTAPKNATIADMRCIELPEYIVFSTGNFPVLCNDITEAITLARTESGRDGNIGTDYRIFNMTIGYFVATYNSGKLVN